MIDRYIDRDGAANLLERRWFSSIAAVRAAQAECEVLREVVELAEKAWRRARTQLAEIETLRDALGDQLTALDEYEAGGAPAADPHRVMSAA
ncbi:MAG TPA: hypothetical protein VGI65_19320 [Steroidobacteraceae bacterium]|jgi:hypothetical protein